MKKYNNSLDGKILELEALLHNNQLSDKTKLEPLKDIISNIKTKQQNTKFKIAVVGEFSSGKTTFLNSILGTDVLATSDCPTTPIPVNISYSSDGLHFHGEKGGVKQEINQSEFTDASFEGKSSMEFEKLYLEGPFDILKEFGIELLDTPGINSINDKHTLVTKTALENCHGCLFLINAKKPGAKSTLDFLSIVNKHINKIFWAIAKTDTISSKNADRVLAKLPEIIEKKTSIKVDKMFALGFQEKEGEKFYNYKSFMDLVHKYIQEDWSNKLATLLVEELRSLGIHYSSSVEMDLKSLEDKFFQTYGTEPIDFFSASEMALTDVKNALPKIISEHRVQALQKVKGHNFTLYNRYDQKIQSCNFKTTLGLETADLEKDLKKHISKLQGDLDTFIDQVILKTAERFELQIGDANKIWEGHVEKIYSHKANSFLTRLKFTFLCGVCFSVVALGLSLYLLENNFLNSLKVSMTPLLAYFPKIIPVNYSCSIIISIIFFTAHSLLVFSRNYNRFFIKLFSKSNSISKHMHLGNYLKNSSLSKTGSAGARINAINQRTAFSTSTGVVAARVSDDPLIGLAVAGIGFLFNEFSGPSLGETKKKLREQINLNLTNIEYAYGKTFDNLDIPLTEGLNLMVRELQKQYKDTLTAIFERQKNNFIEKRKPVDELAGYLESLRKLGYSKSSRVYSQNENNFSDDMEKVKSA